MKKIKLLESVPTIIELIPSPFNHNRICSQKIDLIPPELYVHGGCIISYVII